MAPHETHLTWHGGAPCLWVWDGYRGAPGTVLFAAHARLFARAPVGRVDRMPVHVPGSMVNDVPCLRLSVAHLVEQLLDRPPSTAWSGSLRWMYDAVDLAREIVGSGRVTAVVDHDDIGVAARWEPVRDDVTAAATDRLRAVMPPVVEAAGEVDLDAVLDRLVDAVSRQGLRWERWSATLPNGRKPPVSTVRGVFQALADPNAPRLRTNYGEHDGGPELRDVARVLADEASRLRGEPVVRARLRLHVPDTADGDWIVALEVADAVDGGRWCTARDVWDESPLAVDVAGRPEHVRVLADVVRRAAVRLAATVPVLGRFLDTGEPDEVRLLLEEVTELLELAPRVTAAEVELIGPEQLVRSAARVVGKAETPPVATSGGMTSEALVTWSIKVDGTPVDAATLARAEAVGASLAHVGGRWVRLDGTQVHKALKTLQRNQDEFTAVDPATLLRLAAEGSDDETPTSIDTDDKSWVGDLLAGLPDEQLTEMVEPASFAGELRHYQRRGLAWLTFLRRLGLGGCLADDMGLGKTATTLAHLLGTPGPHLVVCPLSVVRNWQREANRFAPSLHVAVHHGGERVRGDDAPAELATADIVITTYGLLSREVDVLAAVPWSTVVLDEAQAIKNPHTKAARAARKVRAQQTVALTGTPIENRLSELWAILDCTNPGLLGSLQKFHQRFAIPIERNKDADAAERLRRLTAPFVLRRTKSDRTLVPDLPDKIEQIAWADLTREQMVLYQAVVDQLLADAEAADGMKRRGLVLASLTRLKQICNHPAHALNDGSRLAGRSGKLNRFDELVDELLDAEERALVFTQYRTMGELLQKHLAERLEQKIPFLHGGVTKKGRDAMVDRFQDGTAPPLLIVSLKAGGTGLNLTAASRVIHYDRWWNPAVEDQATDRAWRIGQVSTVFVHKLVCTGTLEERIGQLIDDKRAIASAVIGDGTSEAWLSELSTDELRALVTLEVSP